MQLVWNPSGRTWPVVAHTLAEPSPSTSVWLAAGSPTWQRCSIPTTVRSGGGSSHSPISSSRPAAAVQVRWPHLSAGPNPCGDACRQRGERRVWSGGGRAPEAWASSLRAPGKCRSRAAAMDPERLALERYMVTQVPRPRSRPSGPGRQPSARLCPSTRAAPSPPPTGTVSRSP